MSWTSKFGEATIIIIIRVIIRGWIEWSGVRNRGGSSNYNSGVNTK